MDISNMNLVELKALAFDLFAQRSNIDANLKVVNDQMIELGKQAMEASSEVIAEVHAGEPIDSEIKESHGGILSSVGDGDVDKSE